MTTKYGITGFVDLKDNVAKKYSEFNEMYWIKEYAALLYLWPYHAENIVKYQSGAFVRATDPKTDVADFYYELIFKKYKYTLSEYRIYKDQTIVQVALDLFSALKFLHKKKIMHRDIKPQNVMMDVTKDGHARAILIDFSHAIRDRIGDGIRLDTEVVTWPYRAPEVFEYQRTRQHGYTDAIDVWAVGIMFMDLVMGKTMHELIGDGTEDVWQKIVTKDDYLTAFGKKFWLNKRTFYWAKTYWKWIEKMLARDASKRVTADVMYNEILLFAQENKIDVVVPSNGDAEPVLPISTPKTYPFDDALQTLFNEAKEIAQVCRLACQIYAPMTSIGTLIKYLICRGTLVRENLKPMTVSICAIAGAVFYDDITTVSKLTTKMNISKKDIFDSMVDIVQKHDRDLFLTNFFKFNDLEKKFDTGKKKDDRRSPPSLDELSLEDNDVVESPIYEDDGAVYPNSKLKNETQ